MSTDVFTKLENEIRINTSSVNFFQQHCKLKHFHMNITRHKTRNRPTARLVRRTGSTLVEVLVSSLIVGLLLVPTLRLLGSVAGNYARSAERDRANQLAESLLAEIITKDFADENGAIRTFGLEAGESNFGRLDYDDVDDYHGLDEQPPRNRSGDLIPGSAAFRRKTIVQYVQLNDPAQVSSTPTGLLHVQVIVSHDRQQDVVAESLKAEFDFDRGQTKSFLKNVSLQMQFQNQSDVVSETAKVQNEFAVP
jgi:MSHA pilin protein MshD